ncbi:hypothetical protein OEG84_05655 [Hoeflea sp. G2-23]|uniref:Uncharacterized protein n=1 Tax=Hoeflea algicola TaxID=2983763 RepID=A0ABT3Z664_9HYPH|nr:hypothetical protein [Hoeflea algicola]MCY0147211.1 hypothetical protein [Hoeflea algicola]
MTMYMVGMIRNRITNAANGASPSQCNGSLLLSGGRGRLEVSDKDWDVIKPCSKSGK